MLLAYAYFQPPSSSQQEDYSIPDKLQRDRNLGFNRYENMKNKNIVTY